MAVQTGSIQAPSRLRRSVRRVGAVIATAALAALAAVVVGNAAGWLHVTPVLSGSMRGAFNPGDAVLTQRVAAASLHTGDVVNVRLPIASGRPATYRVHRIVSLTHEGSAVVVRTRGDANSAVDPEKLTLRGDQYLVRARLPYLGWVVDANAYHAKHLLLCAVVALADISLAQQLLLAGLLRRRRPQPQPHLRPSTTG